MREEGRVFLFSVRGYQVGLVLGTDHFSFVLKRDVNMETNYSIKGRVPPPTPNAKYCKRRPNLSVYALNLSVKCQVV